MKQSYDDNDRVIALAGLFQSTGLVRDIANTGLCGAQAEQSSLNSLFAFDAPTTLAIFGELAHIRYGLQTLHAQLKEPQQRDLEIAKYSISLVRLADKALKQPKRMATIGEALHILQSNQSNLTLSEEELHQQLAEIYQQHLSATEDRIMIKGKALYLENSANAARIRSLLLAGFRAAVLWRQCHGKKHHLLLQRRKIGRLTQALIQRI